jgi:hypothetical protein
MEPIEVPLVTQLPELSGEGENPAAFADMILTTLLKYPSASLFAEYLPPESSVSWTIDPHAEEFYLKNIEFACSPNLSSFRAVLSRFGSHYMGSQGSNGYALKHLRQGETHRECHFYLSNAEFSGYWIRIYTK